MAVHAASGGTGKKESLEFSTDNFIPTGTPKAQGPTAAEGVCSGGPGKPRHLLLSLDENAKSFCLIIYYTDTVLLT